MSNQTAQSDPTPADRRQRAWARYTWLLVHGRADTVMMGEMAALKVQLVRSDNDLAADRELLQRSTEAAHQIWAARTLAQTGSRERAATMESNARDRLLFLTAQNPELLAHVQDLAGEPATAGGAS